MNLYWECLHVDLINQNDFIIFKKVASERLVSCLIWNSLFFYISNKGSRLRILSLNIPWQTMYMLASLTWLWLLWCYWPFSFYFLWSLSDLCSFADVGATINSVSAFHSVFFFFVSNFFFYHEEQSFSFVFTLLSSPLLFTLSYPRNQSTVQKSMYLKSILNVLLIIAAVCALLYCSLFDNASKRTKCRFFSRAEGRGGNVQGRGFKICQGFIYLIVCYYLYFLERARFINLSTPAPGSRKTKLGYLWWFFQRSRNLFGDGFRWLKYFREKINQWSLSYLDHGLQNKSKFRAISE